MASWAQERCWVNSVTGSGRITLLRAQERHERLGEGACVVDDVTSSGRGRWRRVKGLDRGRERWRGGSGEDLTTAWMLQGGLGVGTGFEEVADAAGSREIFDGKFWQLDGVSESSVD
jgi:hypothetical protein